jgi:hypothetical protein
VLPHTIPPTRLQRGKRNSVETTRRSDCVGLKKKGKRMVVATWSSAVELY